MKIKTFIQLLLLVNFIACGIGTNEKDKNYVPNQPNSVQYLPLNEEYQKNKNERPESISLNSPSQSAFPNSSTEAFSIIGIWKSEIQEYIFIWEIKKDYTLIMHTYGGSYNNDIDYMHWKYENGTYSEISKEGTSNYTLKWKNSNSFTIVNENGKKTIFNRTKESDIKSLQYQISSLKDVNGSHQCPCCFGMGEIMSDVAYKCSCYSNGEITKFLMSDPYKIECCSCKGTGYLKH